MGWEDHSISTRERCQFCHKINPVMYRVPDEVWKLVVPDYLRNSIVCLDCFISFADEKLISWDEKIEFFPISLRTHLEFVRELKIK